MSIISDSIVHACNPPEIVPEAAEVVAPKAAPPAADPVVNSETQVRERAHNPALKIKAAAETQKVDLGSVVRTSAASSGKKQEVTVEYEDDASSKMLDELLNADDDQFDIDDFIKSVRGD